MLPLVDLHSQLDEALEINSDDSRFDSLYYTDLINETRALFLQNQYSKKTSIDPNVVQTIPCEDLELVDPHNCPCDNIPIGCKILRTVNQIPNTIKLKEGKAITSVGPIIMTKKRFSLIDYERVPYVGNGRTTKNTIYAFIYDNYIYIFSKNPQTLHLKKIAIRGVFEDPTALKAFTNCATNSICWTPNSIYPISLAMWTMVKDHVIQKLMRKKAASADNQNNAHDDFSDIRTQAAPVQNNGNKK